MWRWSKPWFRPPRDVAAQPDQGLLENERTAQSFRLELEEKNRLIANLTQELERQRKSEEARLAEAVQAQLERLLTDAAAPVAHLLTQAHLLEVQGTPVQAQDVLGVAQRLVRVLEDGGLAVEGRVSQTLSFDPHRHEPLSNEVSLTPGESVVVRFVGLTYRGKILRKAGVERSGG